MLLKKPVLGKYTYFNKTSSWLIAAIATFCILVYVEPKPLLFLLTKTKFYNAWLFNTLIAYTVVRGSIWGTRFLDNRHPWQRSYRKRWPRHLLLAIAIPLVFCMVGVAVYFLVYQKSIFETNYFKRYLFLDTLAIFLLNATLFFLYQKQANKRHHPERNALKNVSFNFPLPIAKIAYLYAAHKYCFAVDFKGGRHHLDTSLTKALQALPLKEFYMARRSHIINRKAVKELVKKENTRQLKLKPNLALQIMVSRKEIPAFDIWWEDK